jgi:hypothetical protein
MTEVESLFAVVGQRKREGDSWRQRSEEEEEEEEEEKKCRPTMMRCARARTHIYAQSDSR